MNLRDKAKELIALGIAVVVIVVGMTVDLDTIGRWVSGTQIVISSTTRTSTAPYFAGEVLRFGLKDVQSPKVYWVFDEEAPVAGSVEAQFAFPFDDKSPAGQSRDHRVDVFFKQGDAYESASALVRTVNIRLSAKVSFTESDIEVAPPPEFAGDWLLTGASLARFSNARFDPPRSLTDTGSSWTTTNKDAAVTWGFKDDGALPAAIDNSQQAWTWYEFTSRSTGKKLTMAQPVSTK